MFFILLLIRSLSRHIGLCGLIHWCGFPRTFLISMEALLLRISASMPQFSFHVFLTFTDNLVQF